MDGFGVLVGAHRTAVNKDGYTPVKLAKTIEAAAVLQETGAATWSALEYDPSGDLRSSSISVDDLPV